MNTARNVCLFGGGVSAESRTLFAAMTTKPTAARKKLIDRTIKSLKSASVWSNLDRLFVLAAHDSQAALLNWINPGGTAAAAVSSPTFTADRGYTGNGSSSYVRTNFTPSSDGADYTQNSASIWVWSLTDGQVGGREAGNASAPLANIECRNASDNAVLSLNDATATQVSNPDGSGFVGGSRVSSSVKRLWRNGSQVGGDISVSATGVPTEEQWICAANSTLFSTRQIAVAAWGASLSGFEAAFYSAMLNYMEGVGAV